MSKIEWSRSALIMRPYKQLISAADLGTGATGAGAPPPLFGGSVRKFLMSISQNITRISNTDSTPCSKNQAPKLLAVTSSNLNRF